MMVDGVTLEADKANSIAGRSIVIHAGEDDLGLGEGEKEAGSKASGNAGTRAACCTITMINSADPIPVGGQCNGSSDDTDDGTTGLCEADMDGAPVCCGKVTAMGATIMQVCMASDTTKVPLFISEPGFNKAHADSMDFDFMCDSGVKLVTSLTAMVVAAASMM